LEDSLSEEINIKTIAIIGGTGKEGKGLAYRWVKAGYQVVIGSRNAEKAQTAVDELAEMLDDEQRSRLSGQENAAAVRSSQLAVLTVPYQFHKDILTALKDELAGKFLIDVTVPLVPPKVSTIQIPPEGSAALQAQLLLGEETSVISAFQNISFALLLTDNKIECDVLVCGKDKQARDVGVMMVRAAGLTAWDAGPLENAIIAEGFTSVLIRINKQAGTKSAGIQITGVPRD
jgi:NADPH-dependent F420 reductase